MGKHRIDKDQIIGWINRHGDRYSLREAALFWGVPMKTMQDWYSVADVRSRGATSGGPGVGLQAMLARVPFERCGEVIEQYRREQEVCDADIFSMPSIERSA